MHKQRIIARFAANRIAVAYVRHCAYCNIIYERAADGDGCRAGVSCHFL